MKKSDYIQYDALGLAELIQTKAVSAKEVLEAAIDMATQFDPSLNSIVCPMFDHARKRLTQPIPAGPFAGVPFLLKDLAGDYPGFPATMGSRFLADYTPKQATTLVQRFVKAGLITIGKTNVAEFGTLPTTEPELFGPCHNPWHLDYSAGGSSGGSASAVAARLVPMAHGNDIGGSLRIPASCCGVFSLKPSRGRNPGIEPGKSAQGMSCEHVITLSVRDCAAMLDITAEPQLGNAFQQPLPKVPFLKQLDAEPKKLKIAFTTTPFFNEIDVDPVSVEAMAKTMALCQSLGHTVEEVTPSLDRQAILESTIVLMVSQSIHRMNRVQALIPDKQLMKYIEPTNQQIWRLKDTFSGEDFVQASHIADVASLQMEQFFQQYDVLLTPTQPHLPRKLGASLPPAHEMTIASLLLRLGSKKMRKALLYQHASRSLRAVAYTIFYNITGHPAMSVPLYWGDNSLPLGSQFASKIGNEGVLLQLAHELEEIQPWRARLPPTILHRL